MNIISFKNVHFTYPGDDQESLCGIDLDIAAGSFVAVLGHNGSGKSTLAKHMNAILVPDEGQVLIDGIDTADEDRVIDVRRTVGMVFQNPDNQIVANVVEDDVAFAPENLGVPPEEIRRRVDEALKQVDMYDFRMHAPHLLSGGQKQRVAIAGVIAMQPRIIVLDEPTAMLDPQGRAEVIGTITKLCRENGMPSLVERWNGEDVPSRAFSDGGIHEAIADYEDTVFYEILAEELARRDMDYQPVSNENYDALVSRMDDYIAEFEAHGTDNISIPTMDE